MISLHVVPSPNMKAKSQLLSSKSPSKYVVYEILSNLCKILLKICNLIHVPNSFAVTMEALRVGKSLTEKFHYV